MSRQPRQMLPLRQFDDVEDETGRAEGARYRFDHLTLPMVMKDMRFVPTDPAPGDRVPTFDLPTIDGGRFRSSDLGGRPVLMVFGSSTCPVTDNAAPGLHDLHRRFGDRVRFVMVNVREAHPGRNYPQPKTAAAKLARAAALREVYDVTFEVASDDIDGTLHRAMSPKPNSAYMLSPTGTILFRAQWANDTEALATALDEAIRGQAPRRSQSGGVVTPTMRMLMNIAPVLDRAGAGAWADMWLVAPPLAFVAFLSKVLNLRPTRSVPRVGENASAPSARG